jgi:hypothetical protein
MAAILVLQMTPNGSQGGRGGSYGWGGTSVILRGGGGNEGMDQSIKINCICCGNTKYVILRKGETRE